MSAGTSLGSYFRNEGNGGIGKSTYMNANATAPSTATCTNRLILPPPTGDRGGRRENTLTTGLGNGDWKIPAVGPQSRVPQFRVDLLPSGLTPFQVGRLVSSYRSNYLPTLYGAYHLLRHRNPNHT